MPNQLVPTSLRTRKAEHNIDIDEVPFKVINNYKRCWSKIRPNKNKPNNNSPCPLEELSHMELIFQNTGNRGDLIYHSNAIDNLAQFPLLLRSFHPTSITCHTHSHRCRYRYRNPLSHSHLTQPLPWNNHSSLCINNATKSLSRQICTHNPQNHFK